MLSLYDKLRIKYTSKLPPLEPVPQQDILGLAPLPTEPPPEVSFPMPLQAVSTKPQLPALALPTPAPKPLQQRIAEGEYLGAGTEPMPETPTDTLTEYKPSYWEKLFHPMHEVENRPPEIVEQEAWDKLLSTSLYIPPASATGKGREITIGEYLREPDTMRTPQQLESINQQIGQLQFGKYPESVLPIAGTLGLEALKGATTILETPRRVLEIWIFGKEVPPEEMAQWFAHSERFKGLDPEGLTTLFKIATDPAMYPMFYENPIKWLGKAYDVAKASKIAITEKTIPKLIEGMKKSDIYIPTAERLATGKVSGAAGQIISPKGMAQRIEELGGLSPTTEEAKEISKMYPGIVKKERVGYIGKETSKAKLYEEEMVQQLQKEGFIPRHLDEKNAGDYMIERLLNPTGMTKEQAIDIERLLPAEENAYYKFINEQGYTPNIAELKAYIKKPPAPATAIKQEITKVDEIKAKLNDLADRSRMTQEELDLIMNKRDVGAINARTIKEKGLHEEGENLVKNLTDKELTETMSGTQGDLLSEIKPLTERGGQDYAAQEYLRRHPEHNLQIRLNKVNGNIDRVKSGEYQLEVGETKKGILKDLERQKIALEGEIAQATVKPAPTIPLKATETPIVSEVMPKERITTPEATGGKIPPEKPPAPPTTPAGAINPLDDFYKSLDAGDIAGAEAKLNEIPKTGKGWLDRQTAQDYLDDAKALTKGEVLPSIEKPIAKEIPTATGKPRPSQLNLKQFGLSAEDEIELAKKFPTKEIPTQTWDDVQAMVDQLSEDDIKRIIRSKEMVISGDEVKALAQTIKTNFEERNRLLEMLKFPAMKTEATKRILALDSQLNRAMEKIGITGTETGRTLNLYKMIARKTFNPDYWVLSARKSAGRDISTEVINKITELAKTKQSDELAYMMYNLKKGLSDEQVLSTTLEKTTADFYSEAKRIYYQETDKVEKLSQLRDAVREEARALRPEDRITILSNIDGRIRAVKSERNFLLDKLMAEEMATRKPAYWLEKAREIKGSELLPETKQAIINAINSKDTSALNDILLELTPMTTWDKIINVLGIPRSIMSSIDLSAPLRQGIVFIGRPEYWKAFRDMFGYAISQKRYDILMDMIKARETYPLMQKAGWITEMGVKLSAREEAFISHLAEKIPGFGRLIKGSNRAYTGFLNQLRADVFDYLYYTAREEGLLHGNILSHIKETPKLIKDLMSYIGNATGRGESILGINLKNTQFFNSIFFSPKLMASRMNLLNPAYYIALDPFVRKQAIKDMLKFGGLGLTSLGLASLAGADVEVNPLSSDFGKIRIGNTRYDIWGGFQQYIVLSARLIMNQTKSTMTGRITTLGEKYGAPTRLDIAERFLLGKGAPVVSFFTSWAHGKDYTGRPFNAPAEVINRFIPMISQDFYDLYKEGGIAELPKGIPGIFGMGVQTYGEKGEERPLSPYEKLKAKYAKRYTIGGEESPYERLKKKYAKQYGK